MFMPEQGGVNTGTRAVVDGEVVHLRVSPEEVGFLLVNHQLLDQLAVFGHIQVEASRGFPRPGWGIIAGGWEGWWGSRHLTRCALLYILKWYKIFPQTKIAMSNLQIEQI